MRTQYASAPTLLTSKFDSVFSEFTKGTDNPLDKLENEFVQRMITLVQAESNSLIKTLKGATSEEDIDKAKWNLIPRMQQLLWYLWRDGWALGKDTAVRELALAKFTTNNELAEFASDSDSTGSRRSLRNKTRISSIKTPLEDSRVKKAIEDRTLELSKEYSESTNKEIKDAFREFNNSKDKKDARAKLEERIARAIGANNEQSNKRVRDTAARAKVIARTELTGAYNTARIDSFAAAGVKRFLWVANIVPGRTCDPCLERNGVIYTLEEIRTNFPPLHPHCFTEETKILMDDGSEKSIANISVGDRVVTATASRVQSVYNTFKTRYIGQILEIELSDGRKIETTPDHPFWDGNLFIPASSIKRGQSLWVYGAVAGAKSGVNDLLALQEKDVNGAFLLQDKGETSDNAKSDAISWIADNKSTARESSGVGYLRGERRNNQALHRREDGYWFDISTDEYIKRSYSTASHRDGHNDENSIRCSCFPMASRRWNTKKTGIGNRENSSEGSSHKTDWSSQPKNIGEDEKKQPDSQPRSSQENQRDENQEWNSFNWKKKSCLWESLRKQWNQELQSREKGGSWEHLLSLSMGGKLCEDIKPSQPRMGLRGEEIRDTKRTNLLPGFLPTKTRFIRRDKGKVDRGCEREDGFIQVDVPGYQDSSDRGVEVQHTHSSFQGIAPLRVIGIKHKYFDGYVYNFSVENDEVYIANGILVHNCRCTLKPLQEDDDRVKNQKKGIKDAIAPIAAGWLFGKAAEKVSAAAMAEIDKIPDKEEKENALWRNILIAGGAVLGLAGIYYLVTRNPTVKQATQRATKEAVEELGDQVEAYRQKKQAQEGLTEDKQPSALGQGTVTAASLPPSVQQNLPSELVNSNADIRNMSPQEISRLTGMSIKDATRLRLQLDEELAKNPVKPEKTVDKMNNKQLKALGLTNKQINELRRMKRQGQSFATIDDLKKIKGVGDRKIQEIKRRVEEERDPSLVLGGKKIEELSTKELKEYLRLSQNQAVAVREYLRKNRITKIEDLRNVPGIGKETVARAAYGVMRTTPRANINNFGNEGGVSNVNLLSQRTGISRNLAQIIADERQQNGDFADMDDFRKRVNNRLRDSGSRVRLGKSAIKKINDNVTFLPNGEEEKPLIIPLKINPSTPLPQKQTRMGDPRTPQVEPERMAAPLPQKKVLPGSTRIKGRRVSPEERVNAAKLEDERQYRELAKEVEAYHLIPGTKGKITKQVKQRIEQNASAIRRQEQAYIAANNSVTNAVNRIDNIENDVAKLEEAYRTGRNIEEAKAAYLQAIARTEGELDATTRALANANELDVAISRTDSVRSAAEQSINSNVGRQARQKALDAKLKAARVDTTDLENDLQSDRTLQAIDNQIAQLERLSASIQQDPSNIRGNIQNSKARLEELRNRVNQVSNQRASLKREYKEKFSLVQQEINGVEAQIADVQTKLNFANRERERSTNRLAGIEIRIKSNDASPNAEALKNEKATLVRKINELNAQTRSLSRELRELKSQLSTLKKRRKSNKDNRGFSRGGKLAMFVSNMRNGI